ncbi:MAG TPA: alkaline phosphatase family protein [Polyangiaceae bacterium]|jgi:phospholipase C
MRKTALLGIVAAVCLGCGASPTTTGATSGDPLTGPPPDVQTVFTIVFENEDASNVLTPGTFFSDASQQYGVATNYTSSTHPSLPNYIMMTSGSLNGITTDNDPTANVPVQGHDHLAYQLDQKGVMWRAYMESMDSPCNMTSTTLYSAHHDPFLYYADLQNDPASCNQHVVDFDQNFAGDLASGLYKYMWITPNMCDDMHNCPLADADAWLKKTVGQIQASDVWTKGKAAIFVLFDEGNSRAPGASAALPTLVISNQLAQHSVTTAFDHRSYLATVEDIFGLGRLPTTADATPMDAFFVPATTVAP